MEAKEVEGKWVGCVMIRSPRSWPGFRHERDESTVGKSGAKLLREWMRYEIRRGKFTVADDVSGVLFGLLGSVGITREGISPDSHTYEIMICVLT